MKKSKPPHRGRMACPDGAIKAKPNSKPQSEAWGYSYYIPTERCKHIHNQQADRSKNNRC